MELTHDEVVKILKLIEASEFNELHLENGDFKLVIKKGKNESVLKKEGIEDVRVSLESYERRREDSVSIAEKKPPSEDVTVRIAVKEEEDLVPIRAPLLGIFWRRPEPGAPPYVEVGSFVTEDTTVCLIEVMKVFNAIKAGVRGYIRKICVENGQLVEYGQTLFLVKPVSEEKTEGEAS